MREYLSEAAVYLEKRLLETQKELLLVKEKVQKARALLEKVPVHDDNKVLLAFIDAVLK